MDIVDLPINSMVMFHSYVCSPKGIYTVHITNHVWYLRRSTNELHLPPRFIQRFVLCCYTFHVFWWTQVVVASFSSSYHVSTGKKKKQLFDHWWLDDWQDSDIVVLFMFFFSWSMYVHIPFTNKAHIPCLMVYLIFLDHLPAKVPKDQGPHNSDGRV